MNAVVKKIKEERWRDFLEGRPLAKKLQKKAVYNNQDIQIFNLSLGKLLDDLETKNYRDTSLKPPNQWSK